MQDEVKGNFFTDTILDIVGFIVRCFLYILICNQFLLFVTVVPSGSMLPTVPIGSFELGCRLQYEFSLPERGDIAIFYRDVDLDRGHLLTKRIIGTPGDTVYIKDNILYVNDVPISEDYLKDGFAGDDFEAITVPAGQYLMLGDNRGDSFDGRYWEEHFVSIKNIVGKCIYIYSPTGGT